MATKKLTKLEKRLRGRVRNKVLFTYLKPANRAFVVAQAKKQKVTYSEFVDGIIGRIRNRKITATAQKTV